MNLRNILLAAMFAATITASAIPARRGVVHQLQQSDGTTISLELVGDEHNNYYLTTDKKIVVADGDSYYYAVINKNGNLTTSSILAHNPEQRNIEEIALVEKINSEQVLDGIVERSKVKSRANSQDGKGKIRATFPTKGNVRSLVFLVSYDDLDFTIPDPKDYFTRLLNQEGFSDGGSIGSGRDYYIEASNGQFVPEFDVYGPVKLPKKQAYYGGNSAFETDVNLRHMLLHAGELLDNEIDFKEYDLDKDGYVDNVFIFYAGYSEADGGGKDCVWPQSTDVGFNIRYLFDGVQLNHFACGSELNAGNNSKPDGVGTFCHEFAHVLGLPDLYNTENMLVDYTPGAYDMMDSGCNNETGHIPPTFSAYERNALGWMGDDLIEITGPMSCTLEPLQMSNKAYLINTDRENEYFILENRQQTRWDSKLPGHGMLIWHIDYDFDLFTYNQTNNIAYHQRVDLIEANGKTGTTPLIKRKYPFPGSSKVTSFTFDGTPSFQSWSGKDLGLPITDIKETLVDGVSIITFNVAGGGDPTGITDIACGKGLNCYVSGRTINAEGEGEITVTDISGRILGSGSKSLSVEVGTPGMYIVASTTGSTKVIVK